VLVFVPILFVAVLAVAIIVIALRISRRNDAAWQSAAQTLGLEFVPSAAFKSRRMEGRVGTIDIVVDTFSEQHGNSSTTYTRYRAGYPDLGLGLKLRKQTGLHRFGKVFGMQDIEVGDQGFDDAVMIKGDEPDAVRAFLTPSRVLALQRLLTSFSGAVVADSDLVWKRRGVETNAQTLVSVTRRLAGAAGVIATGSRVADRALSKQQTGDLAAAADELSEEIRGPGDTDVETRMTGAATLYAAGRREEAAAVLRDLDSDVPGDREITGWLRRTEQAPAPSPAAEREVDAAALAEDLFGRDEMSYETMARFDDRYRGARVHWSGTVKQISSARDSERRRFVVGIAEASHVLYGRVFVDAVLDSPGGTAYLKRGDTVRFSGVLATCDPLMRNVYLEDVRIEA
jgi:hypothetical protein